MGVLRQRGLSISVATLLAGGGLALLAGSQVWLTVTVHRQQPLPDVVARLPGRTVEPATAGIAVAALAAAVALIATAGLWRRIVGVLVVAAGIALGWRSAAGISASPARALTLVLQHRAGTVLNTTDVGVDRIVAWPLLSAAAGVLVVLAGASAALSGHRWRGLSSRYEAPTSIEATVSGTSVPRTLVVVTPEEQLRTRSAAAAALWNRVDRGEDPTLE